MSLRMVEGNQLVYPRLAILAKKYLAIPASSVLSEMVFCLSSTNVSNKRTRINADLVDTLVFSSSNKDQHWEQSH